jgi:hypothetical protein
MDNKENKVLAPLWAEGLPFPQQWITSSPRKVEKILAGLTLEEQVACVMQVKGKVQQDLLLLSPQAAELTQAIPPEDVYRMIKETGEADSHIILSMISPEQIQYIFDIEWWIGDRFQPKRALDWLKWMDDNQEPQLIKWIETEEFEQKVMLLQALIHLKKGEYFTAPLDVLEELPSFSPDGVHHIYLKVKDYDPVKNLIMHLRAHDAELFVALMDAVIWYPLTQTVENAWRWRLTRTSERGIPEFVEALGIYSPLKVESLQVKLTEYEEIDEERGHGAAPFFPLAEVNRQAFLGQCLSQFSDQERLKAIRWELVYLANKVMVADKEDPTLIENHSRIMQKVLGYLNIGLQLATEGNIEKGIHLLKKTWMQFLFQAGHGRLTELKRTAEQFVADHGSHANYLFMDAEKDQMASLVHRFPKRGNFMESGEPLSWSDFASMDDVIQMETFLRRWSFNVRFSKQGLNLSENQMQAYLQDCEHPGSIDSVDMIYWVTTSLARFLLFEKISSEPLSATAVPSFLDMIFMKNINPNDRRICDAGLIEAFHQALLKTPMAWTDEDKRFLGELLQECVLNLEAQFGRLDPKAQIQWKFTHGLCIEKAN